MKKGTSDLSKVPYYAIKQSLYKMSFAAKKLRSSKTEPQLVCADSALGWEMGFEPTVFGTTSL